MSEDFSGKVYERIALALVVARQKQLGIPVLINIWPKLPREIKLNTIRDAIAVLEALRRYDVEEAVPKIDANVWLDDAIEEAQTYLKEIGVE